MFTTLQVVLECHSLPSPGPLLASIRRLGIQEGREVIEDVPFEAQAEIRFQFPLQAELDPPGEKAVFKGKFVQGPRTEQFVYLCWGDRQEGAWTMLGRAKIPLDAVPLQQVRRAMEAGGRLRARIRMSDARGKPSVAMLKTGQVEWVD